MLLAAACLLGIGIWFFSISKNAPPQESVPVTSIEGWVYTPIYAEWINEFDSKHPEYHIEVRTFRSPEQLYDELNAALSANAAPQFAEVSGLYGIPQLAESGMLLELNQHFSEELWEQLHPALVSSFAYEDRQWAMPIGGEIPVVYYNLNLLELAGIEEAAITDSAGMLQAASKLTMSPRGNASNEKWGLAADKDVPWYLINWAYANTGSHLAAASWENSIQLWHELVFGEQQVMKQLQHHLAASDFVNGQVAMLISSSGKLPMLSQYIGGKFSFDWQLLPLLGDSRQAEYTANARGMVLIPSQPEKEEAAQQLLAFMLDPKVQADMLQSGGQIPAHEAFSSQLEDGRLTPMAEKLLSVRDRLRHLSPDGSQLMLWQQLMDISEQVELNEEIDIKQLVRNLLQELPAE